MDYFELTREKIQDIRKKSSPNSVASVVTGDVVQEIQEPTNLENSDIPTQDVIE